jgi:enterochelin esterase-like enzyme
MLKKRIYTLIIILILYLNGLFAQPYERYRHLVDTSILSEHLHFAKNITITVPIEWQKDVNRTFPVIVIFDRQNQRSHQYIINTIDYLTSNEQMPSAIIVGIESEQMYRYPETSYKLSHPEGMALENEQFIFEELLPLLENQYKASTFRLFIGHSRYGYFTTSLLTTRANELNGVISLSPFFGQKQVDLTDSIATLNSKQVQGRKYYRYGIGNDYPDDFTRMEAAWKQCTQSLWDSKGYLFPQADHNVTPGLTIGIALYEIFEKWSEVQLKYIDNEMSDLHKIADFERDIQEAYGNKLEFSLGTLNGKGWFFYGEGKMEQAITAWQIMMQVYPNFAEGYLYIIDAQLQLKQDVATTVQLFTNTLETSAIYSAAEKLELQMELRSLGL